MQPPGQSRHVRRIELGMPASSPEVSTNDLTGSDNDMIPDPVPVHSSLTMKQAQAHYDNAMTEEEEPVPAPMLAFQQVHEEQRYNPFLLEQH